MFVAPWQTEIQSSRIAIVIKKLFTFPAVIEPIALEESKEDKKEDKKEATDAESEEKKD